MLNLIELLFDVVEGLVNLPGRQAHLFAVEVGLCLDLAEHFHELLKRGLAGGRARRRSGWLGAAFLSHRVLVVISSVLLAVGIAGVRSRADALLEAIQIRSMEISLPVCNCACFVGAPACELEEELLVLGTIP